MGLVGLANLLGPVLRVGVVGPFPLRLSVLHEEANLHEACADGVVHVEDSKFRLFSKHFLFIMIRKL
jgi:hypothetical protein